MGKIAVIECHFDYDVTVGKLAESDIKLLTETI